ncbi:Beta propeller domain protein [Caloramator mitchellensis]|uniref:Beta propeller domain protein n=1 Tax=Caloramator mitchellensis TaxID=908809 RepID=A0A0R3JX27_CALMK|nr:beta-propeller domain-containing protein [Caloramator mitchellensis]KRQ86909.1 Beta propeller domain protein [Caloramator mitchellensis]
MNEDREKINLSSLDSIKVTSELKHKTIERCKGRGASMMSIWKILSSKAAVAFALVLAVTVSTTSIMINKSKTVGNSNDYSMERLKSKEQLVSMLDKVYKNNGPGTRDLYLGAEMAKTAADSNSHSKTNVQVEGVDEADIIKTDGKYIYSINQYKNELLIFKANGRAELVKRFNPKEFLNGKEVAEYNKDYQREIYVREMFIYEKEDKKYLVVMSSVNRFKPINQSTGGQEIQPLTKDAKIGILPYRYGIDTTLVSIIDISDLEAFKTVKQFEVSGGLMSSRVNGSKLYMVTNKWTDFYFYKQEKQGDILPFYIEHGDNSYKSEIKPENIMYNKNNVDSNFTVIAQINLDELKLNTQAILGNFDNMYMSKDSLYLTSLRGEEIKADSQNGNDAAVAYYKNKTIIYKFNLKDEVEYVAHAAADGFIINQFSMDEYDGYFRVATTEDTYSEKIMHTTNSLYIFDKNMNITGSIKDIAPEERIYSTRFVGDKLYMVTFKQVDPLFVIDLKNPRQPKILGLLKIPGYSTYLHPLDDKNLIGFGMDTGNLGERVVNKGMKIALFDISDMENPKEKAKLEIGGKGTYSESLYNHKALTVYDKYNLYAFDLFETRDDDSYMPSFRGLALLRIQENGIKLLGKISHADLVEKNENGDYYFMDYGYRAVFIENYMYVVSNVGISVMNLDDMSTVQREKI